MFIDILNHPAFKKFDISSLYTGKRKKSFDFVPTSLRLIYFQDIDRNEKVYCNLFSFRNNGWFTVSNRSYEAGHH